MTKKAASSKGIIRREFERKKEQLLREKQLDIILEKRHLGLDDFKQGDMKPFIKSTKLKLKKMRKGNLIK